MKQRIWIVIILLMCTCMICFGAYRLCTREDNEYKESRNPYYTGLDIVLAPPAVESKEYDYTGFKVSTGITALRTGWHGSCLGLKPGVRQNVITGSGRIGM